jgi:hypothetical protein
MVHRVHGLEPGLYMLVRDAGALADLKQSMRPEWIWQKIGPDHLPLFLLLPFDLREVAKMICCHQNIGADSCFALGMIAHFETALHEPWRYRHLFWECGVLGQVLYLEAEAAGVRSTGIGCFSMTKCMRCSASAMIAGNRSITSRQAATWTIPGCRRSRRMSSSLDGASGRPIVDHIC